MNCKVIKNKKVSKMKYVFEERLNILLSELLNQMGVISHSEQLGEGRKDVIVHHQGLRIVLEGSYTKSDAESDAKKRIEQLAIDLAIGIQYPKFPQDITEIEIKEKLKSSNFYARVIFPKELSGTLFPYLYNKEFLAEAVNGWIKVNLSSLANLIRESAQFVISEEHIEEIDNQVSKFIEDFVNYLSYHKESSKIAKNLNNILFRLHGFSIGEPDEIKEIIFAQTGLALLLSSIYYESIRYTQGFKSLRILKKTKNPHQALEKASEDILKINYEPIFKTTKEVLRYLPQMHKVLDKLIQLAIQIASKKSLLRRDIAGKIYHRIVGNWSMRKGLATFFTQIPSAYLLLYLAKPQLSRICDFACGSGTLLTAAYSATRDQYSKLLLKENIDKDPKEIDEEFHKNFIENCYGFDVLNYATQITAVNLALHSPETPLKDFNTYTLPLGFRGNGGITSLGSLEFAKIQPNLHQIIEGEKVTRVGLSKIEEELLKLEPFNLIVMNPPFARATGRGGKVGGGLFGFIASEEIKEAVIRDYKILRETIRKLLIKIGKELLYNTKMKNLLTEKDFRPYRSIGQAGEGLLFLYLANSMLEENGKICFVLPRNLLSGVSWFLARTLLASKYHIEYIVVSYDPENGYNFSESTSLSECLLVARKTKEHSNEEITKFIILLRKPETSFEAVTLANQISLSKERKEYVESGKSQAFIIEADRVEMLEYIDNWGRFIFLPNLTILQGIKDILNGTIKIGKVEKKIPITRLNNIISSIGVDAHQFDDNFMIVRRKVPGCLNVLHGGSEKIRKFMTTQPNSYALPKKEGKKIFRERAGNLLLPDRIWVDTAHVISMISEKPTLSNIFYVIKLRNEDEDKLKALCLWLNTTWGILTILANRQETRGAWIRLKMSQWRLLPVLDVNKLSENKLKSLANVYDKFKNTHFMRIPEQYDLEKSKIDESRKEMDLAFLKAMGISVNENDLLALYKDISSSMNQWIGKKQGN